jgi:hypothetical protein
MNYYRKSDPSDVRDLDSTYLEWVATDNPKANDWELVPPIPTYNSATEHPPVWGSGEWVVTPLTPEEIAAAARKVWATVADFWGEFTAFEQILIIDSTEASIRLLLEALRMWRGEVWSDDLRVTGGLDALVAANIISLQRRQEILAK